MNALMKVALPLAIAATGCIPSHDYEGTYEMTYDAILKRSDKVDEVRAGLTIVEVRSGQAGEYLVDLGSELCQLSGPYVQARTIEDWPYIDLRPQACWLRTVEGLFELSVGGTATFDDSEERFSIVLGGTFADGTGRTLGSVTLDLSETW